MWCVLIDERSSFTAAMGLIYRETPEEIAKELIDRCKLVAESLLSDYAEYDINTIEDMANLVALYQDRNDECDDDEDLSFIADEVACYANDYLKLIHLDGPIADTISNFYFEFGDCTEETSAAAKSYAEFVVAFNEYIKEIRSLSNWRMIPGIPEDEVDWEGIDEEIRHITGQYGYFSSKDEEKLKYLRREE